MTLNAVQSESALAVCANGMRPAQNCCSRLNVGWTPIAVAANAASQLRPQYLTCAVRPGSLGIFLSYTPIFESLRIMVEFNTLHTVISSIDCFCDVECQERTTRKEKQRNHLLPQCQCMRKCAGCTCRACVLGSIQTVQWIPSRNAQDSNHMYYITSLLLHNAQTVHDSPT